MPRKRENKSMFDLEQKFVELLYAARQGFDPETGEATDEELLETVDKAFDELKGDIEDKVAGTAFVILRLGTEADFVDQEIKRLRARKDKLKSGQARLKDRLRDFMTKTGTQKVEKPQIAVTCGKPQPVVDIVDPTMIPAGFMVTPETPAPYPDKNRIKNALKTNGHVPGCLLREGKSRLLIR